jgi:hypothetical protein
VTNGHNSLFIRSALTERNAVARVEANMQESKANSAERAAFLDDMHALLNRLDASEYSLAAARLSSAIDALSDEMINVRVCPAASSGRNVH